MFDAMYGGSSQSSMSGMSMYSNSSVWSQLFDNKEILESQYTVLAGHWPESYNEVVLVVNENNEIDDYTLYSIGLKDPDEITDIFHHSIRGSSSDVPPFFRTSCRDVHSLHRDKWRCRRAG